MLERWRDAPIYARRAAKMMIARKRDGSIPALTRVERMALSFSAGVSIRVNTCFVPLSWAARIPRLLTVKTRCLASQFWGGPIHTELTYVMRETKGNDGTPLRCRE